jgi:predicted nucleic acid-binding protein
MNDKIFFDTNVILYSYSEMAESKNRKCFNNYQSIYIDANKKQLDQRGNIRNI